MGRSCNRLYGRGAKMTHGGVTESRGTRYLAAQLISHMKSKSTVLVLPKRHDGAMKYYDYFKLFIHLDLHLLHL